MVNEAAVGYVQKISTSFFSTGGTSCIIDGLSRLAWLG
jgi:hypothetical protein